MNSLKILGIAASFTIIATAIATTTQSSTEAHASWASLQPASIAADDQAPQLPASGKNGLGGQLFHPGAPNADSTAVQVNNLPNTSTQGDNAQSNDAQQSNNKQSTNTQSNDVQGNGSAAQAAESPKHVEELAAMMTPDGARAYMMAYQTSLKPAVKTVALVDDISDGDEMSILRDGP